MTGEDDVEPLAAALEPWFDSEKPFAELPEAVQERIQRILGPAMAAVLSTVSSPRRRRSMAQHWDIQNHSGLALERSVLWKKNQEAADCERTASRIPLEERTMKDVKSQEKELRKLRKELAALEVELQQKAQISA